jgi:hypothetical protein
VERIPRVHPVSAPGACFFVVIPCYNYGRYLPLSVGSVLNQTGVDVEVLIIDDASPDGSGQVAQQLAAADPRVRALVHDRNLGHIATYNEGLTQLSGDYFLLLSADDLLTPGALARAAQLFESRPDVGMVYGRRVPLIGTDLPRPSVTGGSWTVWTGRQWVAQLCRLGRNVVQSPEVVLRAEVQRHIGAYRADLPHSGDMEMWLRAASVSGVGRLNNVDQAYYREHAASMSRSKYSAPLLDLEGRRAAFDAAFEGLAGELPDPHTLHSQALRSLADAALDLGTKMQQEGGPANVVQALADFAVQTWPAAEETLRYRALRLRAEPGPVFSIPALRIADRTASRAWRRAKAHTHRRRLGAVSSDPSGRRPQWTRTKGLSLG